MINLTKTIQRNQELIDSYKRREFIRSSPNDDEVVVRWQNANSVAIKLIQELIL